MTNFKTILTPALAAILAATSLAGAQTARPSTAPPSTASTNTAAPRTRGDRPAPGPVTVKYYAGNPLQGGKVLSTATLQPPAPANGAGRAANPANPFANAPKGTTHVAVGTPFGTRITTLQDAQARPFGDRHGGPDGGRGGRGGDGRGDRGGAPGDRGAPNGPNGAAPGGPADRDPNAGGLRLPGLRDATSVAFYAADPLSGAKATSTVKLASPPTAAQQAALTQAAAKAKFAVVARGGETTVVNLSALPERGPRGAPNAH